jgi:hypothetical protein
MLFLASRRRTSEMCEDSISRKFHVSLSALSGIFCRVGNDVLPTLEVLELTILRHLRIQLSIISSSVQQRIRRAHGERRAARHVCLSQFANRVVGVMLEE